MTDELDSLTVFIAVAEQRSLRAAGDRLGVTGSAVSQSLRRLEDRLGVALVQRTTRSTRLTEVGQRLYASVRPALEDVRNALTAIGEMSEEPRGRLRLYAGGAADGFLSGSVLASFLFAHPNIELDITVGDAPVDIVAGGFDAGIQLGEVIDRDMIAVPVSGDLRLVVVGTPSYVAQHGMPQHPRDLASHACVNWHPSPDAPPYRWEFTENERDFSVAVRSRLLTTDGTMLLRMVREGVGLAMLFDFHVQEDLAQGRLVPMLQEYCTAFPGFYLHYPQKRQASAALRAFIDHLRVTRRSTRKRRR
ncbi:MAG TPA: LysR family transcriptional regulator [Gemmatimonas aurantiaca]|uniref:LysR family transcriptional regulator n=2 Tax=Gemmatimonas aurantiaca TaxID=173480 RepID=C1AAC8_GEMAT|nr:LysR family transcriptional regulator [Gemmatimonas aurantiaca]BAH39726.1 LysR family transcriptional regulator [Gemmatimonas aurantiaca T-27]HCT58264.1 LysR family transcriptional regulator [Gemmatimonas aurantiaca]